MDTIQKNLSGLGTVTAVRRCSSPMLCSLSQAGWCPITLSCSHALNHADVPGYREHKYAERCFLRRSVQSYQLHRREDAPGAEHGHSDMPARNTKQKNKNRKSGSSGKMTNCVTSSAGFIQDRKVESGWTCNGKVPLTCTQAHCCSLQQHTPEYFSDKSPPGQLQIFDHCHTGTRASSRLFAVSASLSSIKKP